MGFSMEAKALIPGFFNERLQRVNANGVGSHWVQNKKGMPQTQRMPQTQWLPSKLRNFGIFLMEEPSTNNTVLFTESGRGGSKVFSRGAFSKTLKLFG